MCRAKGCDGELSTPIMVTPAAEGARGISLQLCAVCDFLQCPVCKVPVINRTARSCPKGHSVYVP